MFYGFQNQMPAQLQGFGNYNIPFITYTPNMYQPFSSYTNPFSMPTVPQISIDTNIEMGIDVGSRVNNVIANVDTYKPNGEYFDLPIMNLYKSDILGGATWSQVVTGENKHKMFNNFDDYFSNNVSNIAKPTETNLFLQPVPSTGYAGILYNAPREINNSLYTKSTPSTTTAAPAEVNPKPADVTDKVAAQPDDKSKQTENTNQVSTKTSEKSQETKVDKSLDSSKIEVKYKAIENVSGTNFDAERIKIADMDGDGKLTALERKVIDEYIDKLDGPGNGRIDRDESNIFRKEVKNNEKELKEKIQSLIQKEIQKYKEA